MAEPRRRMTAPERRAELLEAAGEVFGRSGYHGASLDEIATAAGVSKALIYEHFASKRELHAELVEQHAGESSAALRPVPRPARGRGRSGCAAGIDAFLGFVEENRDAWRALFRDAPDPEVAEADARVREQAAGVVAGLMAADTPREPGVTAKQRAQFFEMQGQLLAGAIQVLAHWWTDHPSIPRETVVDRAMEFCWIGLDRVSQGEVFRRGKIVR